MVSYYLPSKANHMFIFNNSQTSRGLTPEVSQPAGAWLLNSCHISQSAERSDSVFAAGSVLSAVLYPKGVVKGKSPRLIWSAV